MTGRAGEFWAEPLGFSCPGSSVWLWVVSGLPKMMQSSETHSLWQKGCWAMATAWVTAVRVGTGWWHRPGSLLNVSVTRC